MFGPIPIPGSLVNQEMSSLFNKVPASADTIDNPNQSVDNRQALELPVDKVELTNEAQNVFAGKDAEQKGKEKEAPVISGPTSNSSVRFRILKDLSNRIQSRIVDRNTQKVIRSVPPEELVNFYESFRKVNEKITAKE